MVRLLRSPLPAALRAQPRRVQVLLVALLAATAVVAVASAVLALRRLIEGPAPCVPAAVDPARCVPPGARSTLKQIAPADLICAVVTSPASAAAAVAAANTWARRSDAPVVYLGAGGVRPTFPATDMRRPWDRSWCPVLPAVDDLPSATEGGPDPTAVVLRHLWAAYPSATWFAVVNDGTFLVVANLLRALDALDPAVPFFSSRASPAPGSATLPADLVVNRAALDLVLVGGANAHSCGDALAQPHNVSAEVARCLQERHRVAPRVLPGQYHCASTCQALPGEAARQPLVDYPIAFHAVPWDQMGELDYFLFHVNEAGSAPRSARHPEWCPTHTY